MKIIGIMAQKGGAGKSTLAVHLAVKAGKGTFILDTDPQGSATIWHKKRNAEFPLLAQADEENLESLKKAAEGEGAKTVFVDAPPHNEEIAGEIAAMSDFVIIACRPGFFDLNGIASTVATLIHRKTPGVIVLNACEPMARKKGRGVAVEHRDVTDAREVLTNYQEFPVYPGQITQSLAFSHSLNDGRAVMEFEPKSKASKEINELWKWVSRKVGK